MEQENGSGIRVQIDGPIGTLTLARPRKRNAMSPSMWAAMAAAGEEFIGRVAVVIVNSEGPSFSAGLDLRMFEPDGIPGEGSFASMATMNDEGLMAQISAAQAAFSWLRSPEIISVAAVQGHAIGGGFQLALACDIRVLSDDAQLCMMESRLGIVPDMGGSKPLVEQAGLSRALEICLTARFLSAAEAQAMGLANMVVPREELNTVVGKLVAKLIETPHDAATETKRLLQGSAGRSHDEQLRAEREAQLAQLRRLVGDGAVR